MQYTQALPPLYSAFVNEHTQISVATRLGTCIHALTCARSLFDLSARALSSTNWNGAPKRSSGRWHTVYRSPSDDATTLRNTFRSAA
jgi:hypothetical protein